MAAVEEKKASKTEREPSAYDLNTFTTWLLKVDNLQKSLSSAEKTQGFDASTILLMNGACLTHQARCCLQGVSAWWEGSSNAGT